MFDKSRNEYALVLKVVNNYQIVVYYLESKSILKLNINEDSQFEIDFNYPEIPVYNLEKELKNIINEE